MNHKEDKFVRFHPDYSSDKSLISERDFSDESGRFDSTVKNVSKKIRRGLAWSSDGIKNIKKSMHFGSLSDAELSDSNNSSRKVLDPQGAFLQKWNKIFVISCVVAVSMDPLFFYIPVIDGKKSCLDVDRKLEIAACVLRFFTDIFYMIHIIFQFRTGFIAPSSRVFGRGVLVRDSVAIARRYMTSYFLIDILAVLPLPQVAVLIIIPQLRGSTPLNTKNLIRWIVLLQYVPRFLRIYPLYKEVTKTSGIITETAWAGAAFNLFIYLLASHICGALWYLFSIERKDSCWRAACHNTTNCNTKSLYCDFDSGGLNKDFLNSSCPNSGDDTAPFNFGVYLQALQSGVVESRDFPQKLFYCFWWGLQSLSSLGQNLETSTYVWEIAFAVSISISGLVLFALLIGNMQTYLQSNTLRLEEMRVKRRDAEQWMQHRLLPANLRDRIRKYEQYKWQETRGVDEQFLLSNLPRDLRREIKSHLCLSLLRRVPMFEKMDDQLLDAMCDRLKPALYTNESTVIREGDPVDEMLFVMRGNLLSETTNGGRTGFMNRDQLKPGDFCGEELLTWALDPNSSTNLPISTRTVQSKSEVEGFVLMADDLKFVASQFRRLHSKQIRHTFRLYSHQWRTWAACFIQAAWRRHCKKKLEDALAEREDRLQEALLRRSEGSGGGPSFGATINVSRFATKLLRRVELKKSGAARRARMTERLPQLMPPKPAEPDFSNFTQ